MFILKLAGKILLLPVWLILFVIGLAVKMTVQTYAVVRGILGFIFTLLIIATAYCYHDWVQVAFLFSLSVILYLILFAGVFVDTVLDMTRERIIDFRYLSEHSEIDGSVTTEPRLEDLYLWLFPQTDLEKEDR